MQNPVTAAIMAYIEETYGAEPEFLWRKTPNAAVFRHQNNKKWFALLMPDTLRERLGIPGDGAVDILNLKCDPRLSGSLLAENRVLPGYHMNKEHWITVLLDGSLLEQEIFRLIDLSYGLTRTVI